MGLRFRKSIKINDLLKLNISKSGLSVTAGKKGASINLGNNGGFLNLGLPGTGLSYRKKIIGKHNKSNSSANEKVSKRNNDFIDTDIKEINDYNNKIESLINIHKYSEKVINKQKFRNNLDNINDVDDIVKYQKCIDGDENTIEELIGDFNSSLDYDLEINVNYELEDNKLYVDLDLPEIENLPQEYPILQNNKIVYKKKSSSLLKEEYANAVVSLAIFLSSSYFNISSYIEDIIISGYTQVRNTDGDLCNKYIYSVKFNRDLFEKTDINNVDDIFVFISKFENRINVNNYSFKEIKPFSPESIVKKSQMIEESLSALKNLGYKNIDSIKIELEKQNFNETQDFIKFALKNLSKDDK